VVIDFVEPEERRVPASASNSTDDGFCYGMYASAYINSITSTFPGRFPLLAFCFYFI
jgi:hypothetical protein